MITHILIVDDDEDDRALFCDAVRNIDSSIQCAEAKDGGQALSLLRSPETYKPDFIFLDLNMPGVNGMRCLRELKGDTELKHIPVIIYTSSKLEKDKIETRKMGAVHFITKPSKLADLYRALSFVLERRFEGVVR